MSTSPVRPRSDRVVAGVCGAIAARFGLSSSLVRVFAVVGLFFFGWTVPVYVALWLMLPDE